MRNITNKKGGMLTLLGGALAVYVTIILFLSFFDK